MRNEGAERENDTGRGEVSEARARKLERKKHKAVCFQASQAVLSNRVATNHMWLFKFKRM